ncbi:MAG TPA: mycofactocin precursor MftA [Frankiaceae bacterium]|nr:mycofactocin precursor MftA [Frankiaceae bacterium]
MATTSEQLAHVPDTGRQPVAPEAPVPDAAATEVVDDLLVEEVSIDGMCGVY